MDIVAESVFPDVTLTDLSQIRQFMRTTADTNGYPSAAIDELIVAVNEALSNIVRHSYQNKPGAIKVSMVCSQGAVKVTLHDNGPGFDPTSVPTPDTTLPLEKRPFGGMGVHMMRTFCDELTYRKDAHGGNELTFLKRIDG